MKELSDQRQKQIDAIKTRLNHEWKVYTDHGGNMHSLFTALNEFCDFQLNYDTLRKTLNLDTNTLDFFCVLALCRYWKLDTAYILSSPDNETQPMPDSRKTGDSGKFIVLNDRDYLGNYYGYILTNKPTETTVNRMYLTLDDSPIGFTAALTVENKTVDVKGNPQILTQDYYGTPVLSTFNKNISIHFTNDIGNYYFLYFEYQPYLGLGMYYRKGIAVTCAASSSREPVMQTFVLFAQPVAEEKLCYLPGLLIPPQDAFLITESALEQVRTDNPSLEQFFKDFDYLLTPNPQTAYLISEQQIIADPHSSLSIKKRLQGLILLKEKSSLNGKFHFPPNRDVSKFAKEFLQSQ